MGDHDRGQVDTSAAEVYDDLFVPALFGGFVDPVVDATAIRPMDSVIDLACGTGALTSVVRERTGGRVVGVDLNPAMVAVAQQKHPEIEFQVGDATDTSLYDHEFEVAACQFGLMFYPDPSAGVAEMARLAQRGVVAVWDSIDRSDGYLAMQALLDEQLGADAAASLDAPFALGVDGALEGVFDAAAVDDVGYQSVEGSGRFPSIEAWVSTEVRGWTLGDSVADEQLADLVSIAEDRLSRFSTPQECVFAVTAKIAVWGS